MHTMWLTNAMKWLKTVKHKQKNLDHVHGCKIVAGMVFIQSSVSI